MRTPSRPVELTTGVLVGIFVGGRSRRMGGVPKGLLASPEPGLTVIERLVASVRALGPGLDVTLVGTATAYGELGLPELADALPGSGPLGGLLALLERATSEQRELAVALACDLPYLTPALLGRVIRAAHGHAAAVPVVDGVLQPLCAAYRPEPCLAVARAALGSGERALFRVAERLGADAARLELGAADARLLHDWDSPDDLQS